MRKKIVAVLLIIIFLFSTVNVKPIYAEEDKKKSSFQDVQEQSSKTGADALNSMSEDGKVTIYSNGGGESSTKPKDSKSQGGGAAGTLASLLVILPNAANTILTIMINSGSSGGNARFSIQNTVFNQYALFNINFFSPSTEYRNNTTFNESISRSVAQWFFICRNISLVILLLMLVYVAIRMAISTVATEKAKYKKMLISWIESMVILFVLQYIFIILIMLSENILTLIKPLMDNLNADIIKGATFEAGINELDKNFEIKLITGIKESIAGQKGWNKVWPVIEYFVLVFYQIKFFIVYLMRKIKVAFLIMISPLITITYSADKVGDNKAQAFNAWLKEIVFQIFIQDLHAIMYLVFVLSAAAIAEKAPALAIVFLIALSNAEKIVKKIFDLKGDGIAEAFSYQKLKEKFTKDRKKED